MTDKSHEDLRVRPYWHVDVKWVFGILLFFSLGLALLLFNLSSLTERSRAVEISATVIASLFSKNGLDDDAGLAEFRQKVTDTPGDTIVPIPQFPNITITKQQALTLQPRDLRIAIFSQITQPIYDKGVQGAAAVFTDNPSEQRSFAHDAAALGIFTNTTHQALARAFTVAAIVAIGMMAGLIMFSAGWGRLVSPAVVLLLVSPVGTLAGLMLLHPPADGDAPLTAIPSTITQAVGTSLRQSYALALVVGAALLCLALAGKITTRIIARANRQHEQSRL